MFPYVNKTSLSIKRHLHRLRLVHLFTLILLVKIIFSVTTSLIATAIDPALTATPYNDLPLGRDFLLTVVFGPIFETILFQFLVIEAAYHFKLKTIYAVLISAGLFGIMHHYNLIYILVTFISGLLYAISYVYIRQRYQVSTAFVFVLGVHMLYNAAALILDRVF